MSPATKAVAEQRPAGVSVFAHLAAIVMCALLFRFASRIEAPWHWLLPFVLVPWLAVLDRCNRLGAALLSGIAMCVAFVVVVFSWFAAGIASFSGASLTVGWIALLAASPLIAPQFIVFAVVRQWARVRATRATSVAWIAGAAWVATDAFFPKLFADGLGHGLHPSRTLRQAADIAGVHGLTFAVLAVNELLWMAVRSRVGVEPRKVQELPRRPRIRSASVLGPLLAALAIPAALAVYGSYRLAELDAAPQEEPLRVALVQADISQYERLRSREGSYAVTRRILDEHFALSQLALIEHEIDWILWPETVYPLTFGTPRSADAAKLDGEILGFSVQHVTPLMLGAYDVAQLGEPEGEYNAAFFVMPQPAMPGSVTETPNIEYDAYRKRNLFPFTERLPALIDYAWVRAALPWAGSWRAGTGPARVDLDLPSGRTVPIGPLICYDALDPQLVEASVRAGARALATLSNDSWFATGGGPKLHLVVAAFRSIESHLPQARSTNTGISAFIDASGEIVSQTRIHEKTLLVGELRPRTGRAHALGHGGRWFAVVLVAVGFALALRERRGRVS